LGVALAALAGGFGQFGAVAALGDVAKGFGQVTHGTTIAEQAGLSGTVLGVGLAVIRLASLGGLPVAALADRLGRRRVLLTTIAIGLALTALAAISPGYWWFVAIFAVGRPFLSGGDAVALVSAAEQTSKDDRSKAVALVAAGYGVGAGLTAIIHSVGLGRLGFRGLFALALVPLASLGLLRRWISEPDRFSATASSKRPLPVLGAVGPRFRRRLGLVAAVGFTVSVITGPANSFVFLYAQNIVHQAGYVTALMVVGAGAAGLVGLLIGQWLADHLGRRPTASLGMVGIAGFGVLAYSGSAGALVAGYVCGVLAGSVLAPAAGAMVNELFPTSVRASVGGWWIAAGVAGAAAGLLIFGSVADVKNQFGLAASITFLPAAAAAGLFWLLPETRELELERLE
jgi:MFS family permease